MYPENNLPQGSRRDKGSGALLFPAHPREVEDRKKREELDSELEEIKSLKKELQDLIKETKGED